MKRRSAFTLIELLIVISILGVLATLVVVSLGGAQKSARDGRRKSDLETVRSALELYRADCNRYPPSSGSGSFSFGNSLRGNGSTTACASTNTYLNSAPTDPISNYNYVYYVNGTGTNYELCSTLEKRTSSLPAVNCGSGTSYCGSGLRCYYKVTSP